MLTLLGFICFINYNASSNNFMQKTFFFSPNSWQKGIEILSEIIAQLISDIISRNQENYFPIVSVLFNFILLSNLIGLVPYSFTSTSHLIVSATVEWDTL